MWKRISLKPSWFLWIIDFIFAISLTFPLFPRARDAISGVKQLLHVRPSVCLSCQFLIDEQLIKIECCSLYTNWKITCRLTVLCLWICPDRTCTESERDLFIFSLSACLAVKEFINCVIYCIWDFILRLPCQIVNFRKAACAFLSPPFSWCLQFVEIDNTWRKSQWCFITGMSEHTWKTNDVNRSDVNSCKLASCRSSVKY